MEINQKITNAADMEHGCTMQVVYVLHAGSDGLIQTNDLHSPLGDTQGKRYCSKFPESPAMPS